MFDEQLELGLELYWMEKETETESGRVVSQAARFSRWWGRETVVEEEFPVAVMEGLEWVDDDQKGLQ